MADEPVAGQAHDSLTEAARQALEDMHATEFEARGNHEVNDSINLMSGHWYAADPHAGFTWMRENAPVYYDPNSDVWGIASYETIVEASRRPEIFSSSHSIRPKTGPMPMMISMDDPEHKKRRKNVIRGFTPRRVSEQEDHVRGIVTQLLDNIGPKGECDFVWDVAAWLPLIVIGDMLGVAEGDRGKLLEWSDLLLKSSTGDVASLAEATQAFAEFWEYQTGVVLDRRKKPSDDLISILINADVDGDLLDDESIIWESLLILIGGDETTRHVISGGLNQLLLHPEQFEELRDNVVGGDGSLLPGAMEEMLRWVSPIQSMSRYVMDDVEFHGQSIRQGDEVLLLYPSANRDTIEFDDPFTFDIHRTPNNHIAFGHGPHFCMGSHVAKLELKVMFEELFRRVPDIDFAVEPTSLTRRPASFVSGLDGMPVSFTPFEPIGV